MREGLKAIVQHVLHQPEAAALDPFYYNRKRGPSFRVACDFSSPTYAQIVYDQLRRDNRINVKIYPAAPEWLRAALRDAPNVVSDMFVVVTEAAEA